MRRFEVYGWTDCGKVRAANEDHILVDRSIANSGGLAFEFADDDRLYAPLLFAVADGIGGAAAGAVASRLCLSTFDAQYHGAGGTDMPIEEALQEAGAHANRALLDASSQHPEWRGMGCTLAGVCLAGNGYSVFHAGDSRVYRIRNGFAKQLTVDDTVTQRAVEAGLLDVEEAEHADVRHTITNSVGSPSFSLHVTPGPEWRDGDALLICSDGLHDLIDADTLEKAATEGTAETRARRLVDAALQAGGHDNVSVIMVAQILSSANSLNMRERNSL